jgi:hypothetical protein
MNENYIAVRKVQKKSSLINNQEAIYKHWIEVIFFNSEIKNIHNHSDVYFKRDTFITIKYNKNFRIEKRYFLKDKESEVKKLQNLFVFQNKMEFKNNNYILQNLKFRIKKFLIQNIYNF